jgi:predicted DNA-binding protein (UPF0251 family)
MMIEQEGEKGLCRRRGRPRVNRTSEGSTAPRCYAPQCSPHEEDAIVTIPPYQLDTLNLIDLQGLDQEQAATVLGISRKTVWRDLHEARRKIADALVNGKIIEIEGCKRRSEGVCPRINQGICPKIHGGICPIGVAPSPAEDRTTPGFRGE